MEPRPPHSSSQVDDAASPAGDGGSLGSVDDLVVRFGEAIVELAARNRALHLPDLCQPLHEVVESDYQRYLLELRVESAKCASSSRGATPHAPAVGRPRTASNHGRRARGAPTLLSKEDACAAIRDRRVQLRRHEMGSLEAECVELHAAQTAEGSAGGGKAKSTAGHGAAEHLRAHHQRVMQNLRERFAQSLRQTVASAKKAVEDHKREAQRRQEAMQRLSAERDERERQRAAMLKLWAAECKRREDARIAERRRREEEKTAEWAEQCRQSEACAAAQEETVEEKAVRREAFLASVSAAAARSANHAVETARQLSARRAVEERTAVVAIQQREALRDAHMDDRTERCLADSNEKASEREALRRARYERGIQRRREFVNRVVRDIENENARAEQWRQEFGTVLCMQQQHRDQQRAKWLATVTTAQRLQREFEDATQARCDEKAAAAARALQQRDRQLELRKLEKRMDAVVTNERIEHAAKCKAVAAERIRQRALVKAQSSAERQELMSAMSNQLRAERQRFAAVAARAKLDAMLDHDVDLHFFDAAYEQLGMAAADTTQNTA